MIMYVSFCLLALLPASVNIPVLKIGARLFLDGNTDEEENFAAKNIILCRRFLGLQLETLSKYKRSNSTADIRS